MEREGQSFNLLCLGGKFLIKSRNLLWNKVTPEKRIAESQN